MPRANIAPLGLNLTDVTGPPISTGSLVSCTKVTKFGVKSVEYQVCAGEYVLYCAQTMQRII
jgi:hypothetical protein